MGAMGETVPPATIKKLKKSIKHFQTDEATALLYFVRKTFNLYSNETFKMSLYYYFHIFTKTVVKLYLCNTLLFWQKEAGDTICGRMKQR